MKTKPMLILAAALICGIAFFARCGHSANTEALNSFLNLVNLQVQNKQTKSLLKDFAMPRKKEAIRQLVNLLCNQTGIAKNSKPIFTVSLNMGANDATVINEKLTKVIVPIKLHRDSIQEEKSTKLTFKIKEVANSTFKIVDVDAKDLLSDYADYENLVRQKTLKDEDIYSPQTLAAFKVADGLKAKYDSVLWFTHLNQKTYYYVMKGHLQPGYDIGGEDTYNDYKMGLLGPDLKEIIPVDYQVIHNLNGTINGLIEVEKDHKRGFYSLGGKVALPAEYDQIFPITDNNNLAVLRKGDDYFYLKNDTTVSERTDLKVGDFILKIKKLSNSYIQKREDSEGVTECNSRNEHGSIYICPSYLVDLEMVPRTIMSFKNPLRRNIDFEEVSDRVETKYLTMQKDQQPNWLEATFYSIRDYFLGGRSDFYDLKHVVIADAKRNRLLGASLNIDNTPDGTQALNGPCDEMNVKMISDSLYEVKLSTLFYVELYNGTTMDHGPYYNYLAVKNGRLRDQLTNRNFSFTKFIKMDDSYLQGCYQIDSKTTLSRANAEMLRYMKNEIYADYKYRFKDKKWAEIFGWDSGSEEKLNDNVDDSLTAIDKYNINFINQKLKSMGGGKVLAAK